MSIYSNPEKNYRPKEGKFKPTPYSQGPHAHAVHDAGGKLIDIPLNRYKFNAALAAYAPGCGTPIRVPGTSGGFARCGSTVGAEKVFCPNCEPKVESAKVIVNRLLESTDPVLDKAMQQATAECCANVNAAVFGGDGEKGRRPKSGYDINCGLCEEWAERVRVLYREATGRDDVDVLDPGNFSGNADDSLEAGHVFIRFNGLFYDFAKAIHVSHEAELNSVLKRFKNAAIGYIKWAHAGDEQGASYDSYDLLKIRRAKTFDEVEALLAPYESEPSFMSMVTQGYFI